jgi:2-dehydro-3-deoxyphosphogluconate aldolase/(4S)-4-hydroxy-2-oxoglutarate aldolase
LAISKRESILNEISGSGLVAVIRADGGQVGSAELVEVCRALHRGGVCVSEITLTSPGALDAIALARKELADQCIIGVGSVLDTQSAQAAIDAGAQFVVAPTFDPAVVALAHKHDRPIIPGALTPNEILAATVAGADMVKVFPANHFGPRYFRDVLAPMPHLKLMPTGGVNLDTIPDWVAAGAQALGVGSALIRKDLIQQRDWNAISELARQFVQQIQRARADCANQ